MYKIITNVNQFIWNDVGGMLGLIRRTHLLDMFLNTLHHDIIRKSHLPSYDHLIDQLDDYFVDSRSPLSETPLDMMHDGKVIDCFCSIYLSWVVDNQYFINSTLSQPFSQAIKIFVDKDMVISHSKRKEMADVPDAIDTTVVIELYSSTDGNI